MYKVSIIIPVYNVKKYLANCLDSVINQSLQDIEILCGDGGSTDGSLEILYEYAEKDSRIKIISKKGSGYGQSVNDCMDIATGEYIGIVESDDVVKMDMYETLYNVAKQNNLDWVRGDIFYYYSGMEEDKQLVRESIIYDGDFYNEVLNPQKDYRPYKSGLRTWSGIYKKDFLDTYGIRHNETPGGAFQDVGFYLKTLYYATRVYFVKKPFYMWRQDNPGSSIHYNSKKLVDNSLREWKLNKNYLDEHPEIGSRAVASYFYRKFFSYLWTIDMAEGEDKKYVEKIAYEEFKEALDKGQLDPNFFEIWEWERLLECLKKWKNEKNDDLLNNGHNLKFNIRKMLYPLVKFGRKVTYKLMQNIILHYDNDVQQIKGTQEQMVQLINCLQKELEEIRQAQMIQSINCLQKELEKIRQEQSRYTQNLDKYSENLLLYNKKNNDNGDLLWKIFSHTEDINSKLENTQQKVLDQGDLLWCTKSRVEDIFEHQNDNRNELMWTLQYELKKENLAKTIESSPLYDIVFYLNNRYGSVISAQHILPKIFEKYKHERVIDFGCGSGTWLWVAQLLGAKTILGLDGEYVPKNLLMIPENNFIACDLQKKIEIPEKYDIAISMEVAEHLKPEFADIFVENIVSVSHRVLFSAAHPGQGGDGHVNEQPKEYWIDKFKNHGYRYINISDYFKNDFKIQFWYRDNIMMFEKVGG